jgi:hypothetical protein
MFGEKSRPRGEVPDGAGSVLECLSTLEWFRVIAHQSRLIAGLITEGLSLSR